MELIIDLTNRLFSLLFAPFERMRPEYALLVITVATGIVMLYLYQWTSNQDALKRVQDRIKAHILEIQLYKTDIYVMLRALGRVFMKNFTYMRLMLLPASFLMLIIAVIVVQCYPRFEYRPVRPGEGILFKAAMKGWDGNTAGTVTLDAPLGIVVDTAPLPVPSLKEVDWRVRALKPGEYTLTVRSGAESQQMKLVVGEGLAGVTPIRAGLTLMNYLESPLARPLPASSMFNKVELRYPERAMQSPLMLGMGWLVYFFVVSFVVALIWKVVTGAH